MRMLWKCMVSASNHCEVDRQRSSTRDLFNAIIRLAGRGRPWITGTGVCSNSIESATNTSKKFALAWQLDSLGLLPASYFSPLLPPARRRCDRRPGARASHHDVNNHRVSNDCGARSKVPRYLRRYILTFTGSGGKRVSERDGQFQKRTAKFHR